MFLNQFKLLFSFKERHAKPEQIIPQEIYSFTKSGGCYKMNKTDTHLTLCLKKFVCSPFMSVKAGDVMSILFISKVRK